MEGTRDSEVLWASMSNFQNLTRVVFSSRGRPACKEGISVADLNLCGIPVLPPQVMGGRWTQSEAQSDGCFRKKSTTQEPENCVLHHCAFNGICISSLSHQENGADDSPTKVLVRIDQTPSGPIILWR